MPIQYILPIKEINKLIKEINKFLNSNTKSKSYKLLDIGAGSKDLKTFLPSKIGYYSLDCTSNHNIKVDIDKVKKLPIKNKEYDIVVCLETLEHVCDPNKVIREIVRITKDNGMMFLSMPNEYNFWLRLQYLFGIKDKMKEPFEVVNKHLHIQLPRVKDIKKLFSNYIEIKETYYGWDSYRAPKFFNKALTKLANIWPSMFTRVVVIYGIKK